MKKLLIICTIAMGTMIYAEEEKAAAKDAAPAAKTEAVKADTKAKNTPPAPEKKTVTETKSEDKAKPAPAAKETKKEMVVKPAKKEMAVKPAESIPRKAEKPPVVDETEDNPAICFARGLSNVSLCWLEIPRCVVYDNYEVPFFGVIAGLFEGPVLMIARGGSGLVDILSFGFSGNSIHSAKFPDYVWEAKWKPEKKK